MGFKKEQASKPRDAASRGFKTFPLAPKEDYAFLEVYLRKIRKSFS